MRSFCSITILLALALAGCAKEPDTHDETLPVIPSISLEEAQTLARDAIVSCERNCHPAVGLLSMAGRYGRGWGATQCTASLVAPDLAVTNGHCVPEEISAPGSSCKDRIWLTFPESRNHPEYDGQLNCSQVVYRRRDNDIHGADYAYLRLERASNRPQLSFSRAGMNDGEVYQLQKVNPVHYSHRVGGLLQTTSCRALFDTAVYEKALDGFSTAMLLSDCTVIPGNSGAPLLAADGSLRGVIFAFIKKDLVHNDIVRRGFPAPPADEIADLNLATNFACMNSPGAPAGDRDTPASCGQSAERAALSRRSQRDRILKNLRERVESLVEAHSSGHPELSSFQWTLDNPTLEATAESAAGLPSCVLPARTSGLFGQGARLHRPFFRLQQRLNRYLQPVYQADWAGFADAEEGIRLESSVSSGSYVMDLLNSAGELVKSQPLPSCR